MSTYPVVHFEMPYDYADRMAAFYADTFGWGVHKFGPDMGNYVTAETSETENGRPTAPGSINGGFFPRSDEPAGQHPSVVIGVDDIAAICEKVTAAGGQVLGEPVEIPGVGLYVGFIDTEGNRASLLQPNR